MSNLNVKINTMSDSVLLDFALRNCYRYKHDNPKPYVFNKNCFEIFSIKMCYFLIDELNSDLFDKVVASMGSFKCTLDIKQYGLYISSNSDVRFFLNELIKHIEKVIEDE